MAIDDAEKLGQLNIYYSAIRLFFAMIIGRIPEEKYIIAIRISYADKSVKYFYLDYWMAFRQGILKNLYKKGLCKIKFITYHKAYNNKAEFEKRFGKIDTSIMVEAQKLAKKLEKKIAATQRSA